MALQTAQRVVAIIADGRTKLQRYQYGDRPIPEPIIQQLGGASTAIVTRNVYGALVLNTNDLMFIDVDSDDAPPKPVTTIASGLMSLFGKKQQPVVQQASTPIEDSIAQIAETKGLSLRLYKTAGGYRSIVTNLAQSATDETSIALLREFGSDPIYVHLCKQQESFRARLTPKPWRMKMWEPPVTYPFQTPQEQQRFDRWNAGYTTASARFASCRFIKAIGNGEPVPGFQELIEFHDTQTKAEIDLPLA
ncbi:MAG TPA: hypothetical protein VFO25_04405 [Candidatus Eremiobacteraceae bacterium]|nr:hypothetical protein [Candidatus Eremiobacteraceae bacterium]